MTHSRNILTALLLTLLAIATVPIFARAELQGEVQPTGDAKVALVKIPEWHTETIYWSQNYQTRPYYKKTTSYMTYEPAYKYGYTLYSDYHGIPFEDIDQMKLRAAWESAHPGDTILWSEAYPAIRDSYTRIYEYQHSPAGVAPSSGTPAVTKETVIIEKE